MEKKWWHEKVAYQIYPKSFYDSNGDGIGDIPGIIEKLDYLKALGVDIVWISPCYPSPFADQGYDISDYYNINPVFGTLEDMDRLLAEAKKRDMYVLMSMSGFKKPAKIRTENTAISSTLPTKKKANCHATGAVTSVVLSGKLCRGIRTNSICTFSTGNSQI